MGTDNLFLGIRTEPDKYQRVKLEHIDLQNKVGELKKQAAGPANCLPQNIEFIYCGLILDDDSSLSSCGVKSGVTIHVLQKQTPPPPTKNQVVSELHVQKLVVAYRAFTLSAGYRNALQRSARPEVIDNIIAVTPGLIDDPVALSIMRDPELMAQFADPDTVRRVVELHPTLIRAADHIGAYVHSEGSNANQNSAGTSTGYSYSLEALSDDDDDDEEMESASETPQGAQPLTRNASYNAITAAQLAAAIANASTSTTDRSNAPANTTAGTPTTSGNVITSEMFNSAIVRAFGSRGSGSTPARGVVESYYRQMQPQLQQMHEMGLVNNSANLRALQTTSGDVQAAVELILSGAFD